MSILWISSLQEREHDSEDEDEDKYADDIDMPGQNFDSKRRITVRNLRIREDTAKVRDTARNTSMIPPECFALYSSECDNTFTTSTMFGCLSFPMFKVRIESRDVTNSSTVTNLNFSPLFLTVPEELGSKLCVLRSKDSSYEREPILQHWHEPWWVRFHRFLS